jgi:hypothetical protein
MNEDERGKRGKRGETIKVILSPILLNFDLHNQQLTINN